MLTPIIFGSRFDDFFIEPLIRHPDGRPPQLCLLPKPFNPADAGKKLQWYFVTKIVLRKNCSSDRKKTFEIRG